MTEYDYSPEAWERYMATQQRIARWVEHTDQHKHMFRSPFELPPSVDGDSNTKGNGGDDSDSESRNGSDSGIDVGAKSRRHHASRSDRRRDQTALVSPAGPAAGYDQHYQNLPNTRGESSFPQHHDQGHSSSRRHRSHRNEERGHHHRHHREHHDPPTSHSHYVVYPEPPRFQAYAQQPQPQPQQLIYVYDSDPPKRDRRRHRERSRERSTRRLDRKASSSSARGHYLSPKSNYPSRRSKSHSPPYSHSHYTHGYSPAHVVSPPVVPVHPIPSSSTSPIQYTYVTTPPAPSRQAPVIPPAQVYPSHLQPFRHGAGILPDVVVPIPTSPPETSATGISQEQHPHHSKSSSSSWASGFASRFWRRGKSSADSRSTGSASVAQSKETSASLPSLTTNTQTIATSSNSNSSKSKPASSKSKFSFFRSKSKSSTYNDSMPPTPPPVIVSTGHPTQYPYPHPYPVVVNAGKDGQYYHHPTQARMKTTAAAANANTHVMESISSGLGMGSFVNVISGTMPITTRYNGY
ncbi:hypothetical protein AX16_006496 [Volvariella volvacea WC 439]|nr:hypothetical protein AX16_006496 [Volvariella volvacea WC 439]